eukprot:3299611-Karenia_brevis.AAC.1
MKNWGAECGDTVPVGTPTKVDYHDCHRNKYHNVIGEFPADETNLTKIPKEVPPCIGQGPNITCPMCDSVEE